MRLSKSSLWQNRREIMFGALLLALIASSIATILIAADIEHVMLKTSPDGQSIRALGGEPFNVSCEGVGGEDGKFSLLKWTKNEVEDISDGDPSAVKIGNKLFLTFTNPNTNDSGSYTCSAIYNRIQLHKKVFLEFYATKPEFPNSYEIATLEAGSRQYLMCQAYGDSVIVYKWYNQVEAEITEDITKPIYVSNYKSHSRLVFQKVSKEQEGSYTCTAKNDHGLSSKVFLVNMSEGNDTDTGKPGFQDAKVLKYTTRSVTFYITTSGKVQHISAKYKEATRLPAGATGETEIRLVPVPNKTYEIGNLNASGMYIFQFKTVPSENDDWSREYNVTLFPEAPELIWKSVGDGSVRLQWFTKTADIFRGTIDKYQIQYYTVQQVRGNSWTSRNCPVTIEVPSCSGTTYTISGLGRTVFYQIDVRAHTEAGYSEPTSQKIYMD